MHMADALVSPAVGAAMYAAGFCCEAAAVKKIKADDLCEKKIPIMGVMGAFVFAVQMIDVAIPATGSCGHIGGGVLLAATLGDYPALLTITAVLIIQCLFFADGGLLALGCNIINIGVVPCLIAYPLVYRPIAGKYPSYKKITLASVTASVFALQLGAFFVVCQTRISGINELPFVPFLLLMQPIHLAIGLFEGVVTSGVLCFMHNMRPEILSNAGTALPSGVSTKRFLIVFAAAAILIGGALSYAASEHPDGLEWSVEKITGAAGLDAEESSNAFAPMPDYDFKNADDAGVSAGTAVSGITGAALTFAFAAASAVMIAAVKKRRKNKAAA